MVNIEERRAELDGCASHATYEWHEVLDELEALRQAEVRGRKLIKYLLGQLQASTRLVEGLRRGLLVWAYEAHADGEEIEADAGINGRHSRAVELLAPRVRAIKAAARRGEYARAKTEVR